VQTISYFVGIIAAIGAVWTYRQNSQRERAKWVVELYEMFFEDDRHKKIRGILDSQANSDNVETLLADQESGDFDAHTYYLNFFELVTFLSQEKEIRSADVNTLFEYYIECMLRHDDVVKYINDPKNGFEYLRKLLAKRLGKLIESSFSMSDFLFTYGTLRPEHAPDEIKSVVAKLTPYGEGSIPGVLFDLGEYPGAVFDNSSGAKVFGTVFRLPDEGNLLRELDHYEGFDPASPSTSLFIRKLHSVELTTGESIECWVYEYNGNPAQERILVDGRYGKGDTAAD